jgi:hypothetical protein
VSRFPRNWRARTIEGRALRLALILLLAACSGAPSTRDVRVTIVDEEGEPLPGALLYVEAYDAAGAYAVLVAKAGPAGVIPDQAREPLKIAWRPGARLALAAFHPGHRPAVVRDTNRRIASDGALLELARGDAAEPSVLELLFPFEGQPRMEDTIAQDDWAEQRAAFRRAWALLPGAVAERKNSTLDAIERRNLLQEVDVPSEQEESVGSTEPRRTTPR